MTDWDDQALTARIKQRGERYAAGSPDKNEVQIYRALLQRALPRPEQNGGVLILGMTPELRHITASMECQTVCVDINLRSIELYKDWLTDEQRRNETIIHGDWLKLPSLVKTRVAAILGDGIFGNLLTIADHRLLLDNLVQCLVPGGALILRAILIPRYYSVHDYDARRLLYAYRAGAINEEEFGFGMRMWGCYDAAYDPSTMLLDNKRVFDTYKHWLEMGEISKAEYALIHRYYFGGRNLIPKQD